MAVARNRANSPTKKKAPAFREIIVISKEKNIRNVGIRA